MGFSAEGMVDVFLGIKQHLRGVEVGVCRGENIRGLLEHCPNIKKIWGIDPWEAYSDKLIISQEKCEEWLETAKKILKPYLENGRAELIKMRSLDATKAFGDGLLDFVYIDGNHKYEHALADMRAWWPKIKTGGILSGHDFREKDKEVKAAVNAFCLENYPQVHKAIEVNNFSWYIRK